MHRRLKLSTLERKGRLVKVSHSGELKQSLETELHFRDEGIAGNPQTSDYLGLAPEG
jgi:hypothetical protein